MTERLIIRNFAGLDNIEIELGRINIFIGPQASGKSVCAKCLYLFKSFIPALLNSTTKGQSKSSFDKAFISRFKDIFPNITRGSEFIIRYEAHTFFVQIENIDHKLSIKYSHILEEATEYARKETELFNKQISNTSNNEWFDRLGWQPPSIDKLRSSIHAEVGDSLEPAQRYILAGRSLYMMMKGVIQTFLLNTQPNAIDPILNDFITQYELARRYQPDDNALNSADVLALAQHVLKGRLIIRGDDDYIITADGRRISITNASSGQQEAFPLLLILLSLMWSEDNYLDNNNSGEISLYIEEPEAHLFPESQRAISQLMSAIYNLSPMSIQYIITTHSPYLLSLFNNLIYAHQLSKQLKDQPGKLKELYKIVPKTEQLPLTDFRVYGLENGKARSLIDAESELLSADLLDSASDVTGEQFGALMALDPAIQA